MFDVCYQFVSKVYLRVAAAQNANVSDPGNAKMWVTERDRESRRKGGEKGRTQISSPDR